MSFPEFAEDAPELPTEWLRRWLKEAEESGELNHTAMALSTLDLDGSPRVRFVLCKGFHPNGIRFFTNFESDKAIQIGNDNRVAVAFYWSILKRQVRIEGTVTPVTDAEADEYFASRSRLSNVGAWASQQSRPIDSRESLLSAVEDVSARYGDTVPRPPHWSGYHLHATKWEFWQDHPGRIHDRWTLQPHSDGWKMWRLQP